MAGHLTTKLRVLREENEYRWRGGDPPPDKGSGTVVFTIAYMLVAPCAIVPAQPFLLPENAPPRPSPVSTFPQANDGASEHESTNPRGRNSYHPNHARARFPLPEKGDLRY